MTNAPTDLLGLRARVQARTGLSAVDVGIVGDSAHAATGGYHEGRTDLTRAGVVSTDYSTRLPRDRAGLTESASAMDIGCNWAPGRAAWLRFNGLLVAALHGGDPALSTVRATNYSPDGTRKLRTDREAGWSTVGTSDVVDVHTHVEWYRDTEGKRAASLDRIDALIAQAISNQPQGDIVTPEEIQAIATAVGAEVQVQYGLWRLDAAQRGAVTVQGGPGKGEPMWLVQAVKDLQTKVGAPAPVDLTDAEAQAMADRIAAALVASPRNPLTDADHVAIRADLVAVLKPAAQAEADALKP